MIYNHNCKSYKDKSGNYTYTYCCDGYEKISLKAGEDGVTAELIEALNELDKAEYNNDRRENDHRDYRFDFSLNSKEVYDTYYCELEYTISYSEETLNQVDKIINNLSDLDREVYLLYYYDRMTMADIGKRFNVSKQAIHKRIEKIKKIVKKQVKFNNLED